MALVAPKGAIFVFSGLKMACAHDMSAFAHDILVEIQQDNLFVLG